MKLDFMHNWLGLRTFHSFLKNGKERKECNILLLRTKKNAKNAMFFCKEWKRTREHFILLQKNARMLCSFFNIYIEIYIDIYWKKNGTFFKKNGMLFLHSFFERFAMFAWLMKPKRTFCSFIKNGKECKDRAFFYKERKRTQRSERSFLKNGKECKDRNVLL